MNTYPHNFYIYVLAELGLIGFGLVMCLFLLLTFFLYRQGLTSLTVSYLLFGLFLFNFTEYQFFFIMGVMLAYNNDAKAAENSVYSSLVSQ